MKLDQIDLKILSELQSNCQIRKNELAEIVGLSLPSTIDRITKLESHGYIKSYNAVLNHKKLKHDITCFIFVVSESSKYYSQFIEHCQNTKDILECHAITGDGSHLLKIRTENTSSLEKLLSKIQSWSGVKSTKTNLVLSSHKETTEIKLKH
ncbi:MAG: Lrp/AsnC family transcriptional regulator [Ignavibacteria bacterium]|nr:Lrp/AsnC family transcriptional regulator [Ignavibacteria bacterium]MBK7444433.1 Lrp/AsnC family transcriptional regulator [Ignavibacteria bacterium]MBK8381757.1 Lrp/AsnC family transcriptional regulator [Ignavibacteria bacterium]MBK9404959.1 Lrp/AsnC family transcriptional regulator [Ignavibacteria bacterium]MBL0106974.1 Lrp/AsnC family transcriptional regulator [Ignavibacteria bacterium]